MVSRVRDETSGEFRDGMPFLGGRLWLDFLNTTPSGMGDLIATPEGLARWLAAAGLTRLPAARLPTLVDEAAALRAALRTLYEAMARDRPIPPSALATVNAVLARAPRRDRLATAGNRLVLETDAAGTADAPLAVIARDFAAFAPEVQAHRLRHCAGETCTMVFYDTSKNATRRWCSMAICGNRHKIAAYRGRKGSGGT